MINPTIGNGNMIVSGAYGRDYTNARAAWDDWDGGKDFMCRTMMAPNTYCSKRDFKSHESIELRYNNDRNLIMVKGSSIHDEAK